MLLYDIINIMRYEQNTIVKLRVYKGRLEKITNKLTNTQSIVNIFEEDIEFCTKIYPANISNDELELLLDDNIDLNIRQERDRLK